MLADGAAHKRRKYDEGEQTQGGKLSHIDVPMGKTPDEVFAKAYRDSAEVSKDLRTSYLHQMVMIEKEKLVCMVCMQTLEVGSVMDKLSMIKDASDSKGPDDDLVDAMQRCLSCKDGEDGKKHWMSLMCGHCIHTDCVNFWIMKQGSLLTFPQKQEPFVHHPPCPTCKRPIEYFKVPHLVISPNIINPDDKIIPDSSSLDRPLCTADVHEECKAHERRVTSTHQMLVQSGGAHAVVITVFSFGIKPKSLVDQSRCAHRASLERPSPASALLALEKHLFAPEPGRFDQCAVKVLTDSVVQTASGGTLCVLASVPVLDALGLRIEVLIGRKEYRSESASAFWTDELKNKVQNSVGTALYEHVQNLSDLRNMLVRDAEGHEHSFCLEALPPNIISEKNPVEFMAKTMKDRCKNLTASMHMLSELITCGICGQVVKKNRPLRRCEHIQLSLGDHGRIVHTMCLDKALQLTPDTTPDSTPDTTTNKRVLGGVTRKDYPRMFHPVQDQPDEKAVYRIPRRSMARH